MAVSLHWGRGGDAFGWCPYNQSPKVCEGVVMTMIVVITTIVIIMTTYIYILMELMTTIVVIITIYSNSIYVNNSHYNGYILQ